MLPSLQNHQKLDEDKYLLLLQIHGGAENISPTRTGSKRIWGRAMYLFAKGREVKMKQMAEVYQHQCLLIAPQQPRPQEVGQRLVHLLSRLQRRQQHVHHLPKPLNNTPS
jgi:hypothetical protein